MHPRSGSNNFRQPPFTNVTKSFIVQSQIISLSLVARGWPFIKQNASSPRLHHHHSYCPARGFKTMPLCTLQNSLTQKVHYICVCVCFHPLNDLFNSFISNWESFNVSFPFSHAVIQLLVLYSTIADNCGVVCVQATTLYFIYTLEFLSIREYSHYYSLSLCKVLQCARQYKSLKLIYSI